MGNEDELAKKTSEGLSLANKGGYECTDEKTDSVTRCTELGLASGWGTKPPAEKTDSGLSLAECGSVTRLAELGLASGWEIEPPAEKTDSGLSLAKCRSDGEYIEKCDMNLGANSDDNVLANGENSVRIVQTLNDTFGRKKNAELSAKWYRVI